MKLIITLIEDQHIKSIVNTNMRINYQKMQQKYTTYNSNKNVRDLGINTRKDEKLFSEEKFLNIN